MHDKTTETPQYITMTEAAKLAPGRPSTSCIWRWCRRGVKARDGQRVRLEHVRVGGMIYTTAAWLDAFGRALAEADAKYFDLCEAVAEASAAVRTPRATRSSSHPAANIRQAQIDAARRELDEAGYR